MSARRADDATLLRNFPDTYETRKTKTAADTAELITNLLHIGALRRP